MDKADWLIEYKATEAFDIPDMSPQSLHSLVQTFKPKGSASFRKYYLFNSVSDGVEPCDEDCKTAQICGITEIDFDKYDDCMKGSNTVPSHSRFVRFSLTTVAFLQLAVFAVDN